MHVILTHEQGDFDAVASLLAAALLEESAVPVLPRRMNRNVRSYLTIYGSELPFVDPRDLASEPIQQVSLVDTQSLVTLKGFQHHLRVQVVDHHQPRPEIDPSWQVTLGDTGATATLLVENLQQEQHSLTVVQATLLLLGIYEDTGSLTYTSTTGRDARAAAFLLEQGASLRIASQYLNPPLSDEQRQVYERLLSTAETHLIHNRQIVIASGEAPALHEEISSIAHKLRDLLEPDAIFLLVGTEEGVRIVARATTDAVNVASVTAHFKGGGHDRAASALIKEDPVSPASGEGKSRLQRVSEELLRILPQHIHPSLTVGQIMSRNPSMLPPQTSAQDAALLMQRYGYEGYPVVDDGKLIGLLTRRAVDRAVSHKLKLTAASIMEAGQYTVQPQQSLEQLQHVMIDSGWGQIPVVDPESNAIIGIVTRTDLLKTLTPQARLSTRQNLAERLEAAMPPARLALLKVLAEQAHASHMALFVVGGFVRDLLLEKPSTDFDVVVEGDAISLARAMARQYGGQVVVYKRFGTANWAIAEIQEELVKKLTGQTSANAGALPTNLDLISARQEFYEHPTALPTVEFSNIKLDLHRRDFTINSLAIRLDGRHYGELHDYWGGLNDLHRGLVRVLHSISFIDDPTRLLRAVRFEQRFGFRIEERTLQLIREAGALMKQVSGDRIRHELDQLLEEPKAPTMLKRLDELGILGAIHPALPSNLPDRVAAVFNAVIHTPPPDGWDVPLRVCNMPLARFLAYLFWLGKMEEIVIHSLGRRLRFSAALQESLVQANRLRADLPRLVSAPPSQVVKRLEAVPLPVVNAVYLAHPDEEQRKVLESYATRWKNIHPTLDGHDLQNLGLPPGPAYRQVLDALRSAWLDGQINNANEEKSLLNQLLHADLLFPQT